MPIQFGTLIACVEIFRHVSIHIVTLSRFFVILPGQFDTVQISRRSSTQMDMGSDFSTHVDPNGRVPTISTRSTEKDAALTGRY